MLHAPRLVAWDTASLTEYVEALRSSLGSFHLLALVAEAEKDRIPLLQRCATEAGVVIGGGIFPELIAQDRIFKEGGALLIPITDSPSPLLIPEITGERGVAVAARTLSDYVDKALRGSQQGVLLCLFDAMVPNIATHLDAWYRSLANRVPYVGANAGSETFTPMPCLFDNQKLIGDGVLLQLLKGSKGVALDHGYAAPAEMVVATTTMGNRISLIDWKPALSVYRDVIQKQYGLEVTRENFYSLAVHFPFGIMRGDGEILVRIPVALAEDDSIFCVGEIPPNSILTLLDARSGSGRTPATLAAALRRTSDLLLFYCAGRRMHKGDAVADELRELIQRTGVEQLSGALSLGEIGSARSGGYPLFHNATIVGLPCGADRDDGKATA